MTSSRIPRRAPGALALASLLTAAAALAADLPPTPARTLSARGPLALSLAAEPRAMHWALETAWPLGGSRAVTANEHGALRLEALLLSAREFAPGERGTSGVAGTLLLERAAVRSATWLGVSLGGPSGAGLPRTRLQAATGVARALSGVQAEANLISSAVLFSHDPRWTTTRRWSYSVGTDTLPAWRDTSATEFSDHSALWTTVQGSLRWRRARWAVESTGGLALGEGAGPRRWAQATVRVQLSRRLLALGSFGERPAPSLAFDGAAQPHTMAGLQFAPWSTSAWAMVPSLHARLTSWRSQRLEAGRSLVRVHCPGASRVELAGDVTDWQPLRLLPVHGGWWSTVVAAEPGVHRVQVRVDGGLWQAPPGLPRAEDGPAGAAAAWIVP